MFSQVAVKDCPAPTMDQEIYIDASGEMIMVGTSKFNSSVNKSFQLGFDLDTTLSVRYGPTSKMGTFQVPTL